MEHGARSAAQERFQLAKAKLYGYLANPADTLRHYPPYMTTEPARYARAYAYHKESNLDDAVRRDGRIARRAQPNNP